MTSACGKLRFRLPLPRWEPEFTSQLFRLAVPIALQTVVTASMQIIDNLMIGALGDVPLAGVTQANRVSFLFQVAMYGAISGASIFVAQYWGRRDVAGVRRTQGVAMVFGLLVAALLGLPSILAPESIMRLLIRSEEGVRAGAQYLSVIGVVYFVQSQSLIQAAVLKSTEQVKLPMFASIAAILTNVTFNTLLIYPTRRVELLGLAFTMPGADMGVLGGALATLIGALVELALILFFSYRYGFANAARLRELLPSSARAIRGFVRIALPVLINEALWAGGTVVYSAVYGRIGDGVAASAAAGVFSNVEQLANIAVRALCHACGVMVGMALGAGDTDKARVYARRFLFVTPALTQVFCLFVILPLAGPIVSIFPVSAQTAEMARGMIYVLCGGVWLSAFNCVVIVSLLRTGGDVRAAAVIDVGTLWVIGVPASILAGLVLRWEIQYVYLLTYSEQLVKCCISLWRYRKGLWVRNIVKEE